MRADAGVVAGGSSFLVRRSGLGMRRIEGVAEEKSAVGSAFGLRAAAAVCAVAARQAPLRAPDLGSGSGSGRRRAREGARMATPCRDDPSRTAAPTET